MTLDDKIESLIQNDRDGADGAKSRFVYAGVLASLFTTSTGFAWTIRKCDTDEWMDYKLQLECIDRSPCRFYNMSCDVLDWPSTKNPTVDFYYKTKEDNLVAFQITRKQNEVNSVSELEYSNFFFEQIGPMEYSTKVSLILVSIPAMATISFLTEIPRPMPDDIFLKLTRYDLISYVCNFGFWIEDEEFKTKKDIIQEFRLFQKGEKIGKKKSFSSPSSSMITWPEEYHVLQVPIEYARSVYHH